MKKLFIFAGLIAIIALIVIPFQESENEKIVMFDFFLENIEGETISIGEFRGEKTLINFWATWCRPCTVSYTHLTLPTILRV